MYSVKMFLISLSNTNISNLSKSKAITNNKIKVTGKLNILHVLERLENIIEGKKEKMLVSRSI